MLGQGVGPVFGGILSQYLGFRSIFWFLVIVSALSLLSILVFLPETLRPIAGNGTVPLHGLHKPWIHHITGHKEVQPDAVPCGKKKEVTLKTVFEPLTFLGEKDVFITLFFGAIVYTVWSMVTSSTSSLFESTYGLNTLEVGLTFLGNGKQLLAAHLPPTKTGTNITTRIWLHVRLLHHRLLDGLQPQTHRARILHEI